MNRNPDELKCFDPEEEEVTTAEGEESILDSDEDEDLDEDID